MHINYISYFCRYPSCVEYQIDNHVNNVPILVRLIYIPAQIITGVRVNLHEQPTKTNKRIEMDEHYP